MILLPVFLIPCVSFANLHDTIEKECKPPDVIQRDKPIGVDPVEASHQIMDQGAYGICYACAAKAPLEYCARVCPLEILDIIAKSNHGTLKEGGYPWVTQHQIKYKYHNKVAATYPISNFERTNLETKGYYHNNNECLSSPNPGLNKDFHKMIKQCLEENSKTIKEVVIPDYNVFIEEVDNPLNVENFLDAHFSKKPPHPINMSYCSSPDANLCNTLSKNHVVTLYQIRNVCCKHPDNTQNCHKEVNLANSYGIDPQWALLNPFEKTLKNAHFMSSFSWIEPCIPETKWSGDDGSSKVKCSPIPIGKDPAFYLALAGDKVNLEKYLEANPTVDISAPRKNWGGMNLLHAAAFSGQADAVAFLLEKSKKTGVLEKLINEPHQGNLTPVLQAAVREHSEVVKLLLDNGAKVDLGDSELYNLWKKEGGRNPENLIKIVGIFLEHHCTTKCKWENFKSILVEDSFLLSHFPERDWSAAQEKMLATILELLRQDSTAAPPGFFETMKIIAFKRQLILHFSKLNKLDQIKPLLKVEDDPIEFLSAMVTPDYLGYKIDPKAGVLLLKNILANDKALEALKNAILEPISEGKNPIPRILAEISYRLANFVLENRSQLEGHNIIKEAMRAKDFLLNKDFLNKTKGALLPIALQQEAFEDVNEMLKENFGLLELRPYSLSYSAFRRSSSIGNCSLLHLAVVNGDLNLTQELIKRSIEFSKINTCDNITPVMMAVYMGRLSSMYKRRNEVASVLRYIYKNHKAMFDQPKTDLSEYWILKLVDNDFDKLKDLINEIPDLLIEGMNNSPTFIERIIGSFEELPLPYWHKINYIVEKIMALPKDRAIAYLKMPLPSQEGKTLLEFAKKNKYHELVERLINFGVNDK